MEISRWCMGKTMAGGLALVLVMGMGWSAPSPFGPRSEERGWKNEGLTFEVDPTRLIVKIVQPDSSAAKADIQPGDWVVKVEGMAVTNPQEFQEMVTRYAVGSRLKVTVDRQGTLKDLWLVTTFFPAGPVEPAVPPPVKNTVTVKKVMTGEGEMELEFHRGNRVTRQGTPFAGMIKEQWWGSGSGSASYDTVFENGLPVSQKAMNVSGHVMGDLTFKDGHAYDGREVRWGSDGGMESEAQWRSGEKTMEIWYQQGRVFREQARVKNKVTRTTEYHLNGMKSREDVYDENDHLMSSQYWDESGAAVEKPARPRRGNPN